MTSPLDEIQFLSNSMNRIQILDTLTDGPATSRELREETGGASSTVARVLDEAEARGWVDSKGSRYEATPIGNVMISEFCTYVEDVKGIHHLGEAIGWLPEPVHALDYRYFQDADITTPTEDNPTAPFDRGLGLIRAADEFRTLTENSIPEYMKTIRDRVHQDELYFEGVIEASFIEVLRTDPDRAACWHDIAHGMRLYDGHVPINMHVVNETALIWLCGKNQAGDDVNIKGLLESEQPAVVSWAESLYEKYRSEAEPLDPGMLPDSD